MYVMPDKVPNGLGLEATPTGDNLHIAINIANLSKANPIQFSTWRDLPTGRSAGPATLTDNYGHVYPAVHFDFLPAYLQDTAVIDPGLDHLDILVFPKPAPGAKSFKLELPARNLGRSGTIRFEVPVELSTSME